MRKVISLMLIVLLLLNMVGYYGLFLSLQYQNGKEMTEKFDADIYDASESFTIDVPISLPYGTDSPEFKRVDGHFEFDGEFYRTVKQRIANDTLTIICVRDNESKNIHLALVNYVKTFADKAGEGQSKLKSAIPFSKDYFSSIVAVVRSTEGWMKTATRSTCANTFQPTFYASILLPPERA